MTQDLAGKTALVTGGGRGLGRDMAKRLAAAGALVAVNYATNRDAADETVGEIGAAGGQAFALQGALGDASAASALASGLLRELAERGAGDKLDILVNNIGGGDYARISEVTQEAYDQTFSNNVRGGFFLTQALLPALADNGRVVNISSTGSRLTDPGIIVYTMAKAAVDAFTRVMAAELGPRGITVNSVAPGFTAGETNRHVMEDPVASKQVIDNTVLRRFGTPEEIADIVYALCSPLGRWITAQNIDASGGFKI